MITASLDLGAAGSEHLGAIVADLADPADVDAAVHDTRKGIKRLRALLRFDTGGHRSIDTELSRIGRSLAPARDAAVLGHTLGALEPGVGWEGADAYMEKHHLGILDDLSLGSTMTALTTVRARWPARVIDSDVIAAAVERMYRKGRKRLRRASEHQHAEDFHAWRKRVKYLRYQLEAVGADDDVVEPFDALGDTLGLEHDHTVFIDFCDDHIDLCRDRRDRYVLIDRAEVRREELRDRALSTTAYAEEPEVWVTRI